MLNPCKEAESHLRREDRFTAAAFVSHASNRTSDQLDKIDLLPKIKHRVMLTKELAPIFAADEKAVKETFGIIAAVLDGKGYRTASGSHGERGYTGDYRFNWIGATTPVETRIHNIMAVYGCRFLFYECWFPEAEEEEFIAEMESMSSFVRAEECNALVNRFLVQHFTHFKANSVRLGDIECSKEFQRMLYRYARVMTLGRRAVETEMVEVEEGSGQTEERYISSPSEAPYRPFEMFRCIAIGSALTSGRMNITADDMEIIQRIAFSSVPAKRRRLLRCLIRAGGKLSSTDVEKQLQCSKPTALRRMRELAATELCEFHKNGLGSNVAHSITLSEKFRFLTPKADGN